MLARHTARIGVVISLLSLAGMARADIVTFQALGPASHVNGVSADGHTAVGHVGSGMAISAMRWLDGTPEALNPFGGGACSTAGAASSDGSIIVGNGFNGDFGSADTVPYRWTTGACTPLPGGGVTGGCGELYGAHGVSLDGSVIVGDYGFTRRAFAWTAAGVNSSIAPGIDSSAAGVSGDGQSIAGWFLDPFTSHREAFRWTVGGGPLGLGFLPGASSSEAAAIAQDGLTIVGTSGTSAFRWTEADGMQPIEGMRRGLAVSADGSVIVGADADGAAYWSATHGIQSLRTVLLQDGLALGGWTFQDITGISADGMTLVGNSIDPTGVAQGFVVTVPGPGGAGALAMLAGLAAIRRRRRTN